MNEVIGAEADDTSLYWGHYGTIPWTQGWVNDYLSLGYFSYPLEGDNYIQDTYNLSLRYTGVNIPQGVTIISAYITMKGSGGSAPEMPWVDIDFDIHGDDVDDAVAPTDVTTFIALAETTATVRWQLSGEWGTNVERDTPELKTIVQEIVNRGSWVSGNDMQFILSDHRIKYADWPPQEAKNSLVDFLDYGSSYYNQLTIVYYLDKGLRIYKSGAVTNIGVLPLEATHKLRFRNGATTYGIPLIATGGADDSGVRIYDGSAVKALPKI